MSLSKAVNITDLPAEVIENIARYLSIEDIDACTRASEVLNYKMNINSIWKRLCTYPEKYFIKDTEERLDVGENCRYWCKWRKYFKLQKRVNENWKRGMYFVEEIADIIGMSSERVLTDFVDNLGRHWLFIDSETSNDIIILDITSVPRVHGKVTTHLGIRHIKNVGDKIIVCDSKGFFEVFNFAAPEYEITPLYKCKVDTVGVLPNNYSYFNVMRIIENYSFLLVGHYLICCQKIFNDMRKIFLHIWDINSAIKISPTPNAYQQSIEEFVCSWAGRETRQLIRLKIYSDNPEKFLICFISAQIKNTQILLFSLVEMKIIHVVAQFQGFVLQVKGDLVLCFTCNNTFDTITVYNDQGKQLMNLEFPDKVVRRSLPFSVVPAIIIGGTHVIVLVQQALRVFNIMNSRMEREIKLDTDEVLIIKGYFKPWVLVLKNLSSHILHFWDIKAGLKLWTLRGTIIYKLVFDSFLDLIDESLLNLNERKYPNKIMVKFQENDVLSILNFEKRK